MTTTSPDQTTIERIAIFGATGDLTMRYLLPALAHLMANDLLPPDFSIAAIGRRELAQEAYRAGARQRLASGRDSLDDATHERLLDRVTYYAADLDDPPSLPSMLRERPAVAYLALPPAAFETAIRALHAVGVPTGSRIVVEKPFGHDGPSARHLNQVLHETYPERSVFRIDHFLHHQTVQNILGLRFANRVFEPLWRAEHVESVEIVWDETLGVEGRVGYFDATGALRDVVQNHLLQLLAFVAMEAPIRIEERDLRDHKLSALRAVRTLTAEEVTTNTVRGRYGSGELDGRKIVAYASEEGVDSARETETFVEVELLIDNWRWAGVPFRLRTGKALGTPRRFIEVRFRPVPHLAFGQQGEPRQNTLRLELAPDRIVLGLDVNGPGDPFDLEAVDLEVSFARQAPPAYGRLLLDVIRGDPTLAIRDDEIEESWRIIDPILHAWSAGASPLREYPAGSDGP